MFCDKLSDCDFMSSKYRQSVRSCLTLGMELIWVTPERGVSPAVPYVIAEPCVDVMDKSCIEECPVDCIYEGSRMLYIHPDECVDCGACEPVCPVEAIFFDDDVPEEWSGYVASNADFFVDLGSPGGAAKVGRTENDPPSIKNLTPMNQS